MVAGPGKHIFVYRFLHRAMVVVLTSGSERTQQTVVRHFLQAEIWQRSRAPAIIVLRFTSALGRAANGLGVGKPIFACYYLLLNLLEVAVGCSKLICACYFFRPNLLREAAGRGEHNFARQVLRTDLQVVVATPGHNIFVCHLFAPKPCGSGCTPEYLCPMPLLGVPYPFNEHGPHLTACGHPITLIVQCRPPPPEDHLSLLLGTPPPLHEAGAFVPRFDSQSRYPLQCSKMTNKKKINKPGCLMRTNVRNEWQVCWPYQH